MSGTAAVPAAESEAEAAKFEFDSFFQGKIAALVLRDNQFMQRTDGLVRPEYFEDFSQAQLVNIALRYFAKYKKLPSSKGIYSTLIKDAVADKIIKRESLPMLVATTKQLFESDISDRDYVIDQVATFARHQAVNAAMIKCIGKLDVKDFEGISKLMKQALDVGAHVDNGAYDFGDQIESRTGERLDRAAGKLPPQGITTGYKPIDERLYHKGWGRRELSVLLGGAKAGKTTALIDFGINAWAAGHNVLYLTLEVAAKIIAERMDANIADQAIMDLGSHIHDVRARVKDFVDRALKPDGAGAKFIIHEFPTGSLTVSDIRRMLERYKAKGIKFDLVVVDYADLMSPERHTDNSIENSKSIYINLRGLAMQEDVGVLTATQTNRDGFKSAVAKAEHVSDDFNKIRIADVVISINRTDEERAIKQARLFFAACRNQAAGFSIRIEQEPDRMKFCTKVLGYE